MTTLKKHPKMKSMRAELAVVGSRGFDSLPYSQSGTEVQAENLASSGMDFMVGYLGAVTPERVGWVIETGMGFMPVTFADRFDGAEAVTQCQALGLPPSVTVWLDLEGKTLLSDPVADLKAQINAWAHTVSAAGYQPGLYVGSPQPFTGEEIYELAVVRYWKAPSRIIDRNNQIWDGPKCGFCMQQLYPSVSWPLHAPPLEASANGDSNANVFLDVDFVQQDFEGRLPTWAVK